MGKGAHFALSTPTIDEMRTELALPQRGILWVGHLQFLLTMCPNALHTILTLPVDEETAELPPFLQRLLPDLCRLLWGQLSASILVFPAAFLFRYWSEPAAPASRRQPSRQRDLLRALRRSSSDALPAIAAVLAKTTVAAKASSAGVVVLSRGFCGLHRNGPLPLEAGGAGIAA